MGFYSIRIILSYVYKILRIFLLILLFVAGIFCCLMSSNMVSAQTNEYITGFTDSEIEQIESVYSDYSSNYDTFTAFRDNASYFIVNIFNRPSDFKVIRARGNNLFESNYSVIGTGYWIKVYSNGTRQVNTFTGNTSNYTYSRDIGDGSYYYYLYGNIPIYDTGGENILWSPPSPFEPPYFQNFSTSEDIANTESGNFTFFIIRPGDVPIGETMVLSVYDFSDDFNGDNPIRVIELNQDSAWFEDIDGTDYRYITVARYLNWFKLINGKKYRFVLGYYDDGGNYNDITYDLTLNISSSTQEIIEQTTQQDISQGISDVNSFLTDNKIESNTVISSLPHYDFDDFGTYNNYVDVLFAKLYQMFTMNTENVENDFIFTFPNGTQMVVQADYIETHCPTVIVGLVRLFYYYVIGRFVIRAVMRDVDKFRQGNFLEAEEDIKTEVL